LLASSNTNEVTVAVSVESSEGGEECTTITAGGDAVGPGTTSHPVVPPRRFVDFPFSYHQELIVEVESLTNRGWGVGRVVLPAAQASLIGTDETDRRWVIMIVPGAIPGEVVKVRVFRNFNSYSEADLVEVVSPSSGWSSQSDHPAPRRVEPRCPVFEECGGCQYQHMDVELQRYWKTRHVQEALEQHGVTATVTPCLGTSHIYGYRSKLTPHYQAPASRRRGIGGYVDDDNQEPAVRQIGFQRQTSRQIVDVERCAIATDPVNDAYQRIREKLLSQSDDAPSRKSKKKGATLLLRQGNSADIQVVTGHQQPLTTTILGMNFTYLAGNFFQNNYFVLPLVVRSVVDAAAAQLPLNDRCPPAHLVDCYCGSGLFAISAASHFESVFGIEINERAVQEARANAEQNRLDNCHFVSAAAEHIFRNLEDVEAEDKLSRDRTVVVLDPPRKGCSESFLQQLLKFAPARIVYLSCDPVTQARDVASLLQHDGVRYEIESVQPFDLFPQTRHIECLVVLNRL
jgi:23S rRNA (uracil1939-C5)-methyltransferase/tRNA (uracil-5-)-methyltransferase